jgi:NTE family protein
MRTLVASGGAFKGAVQVGMIDGLCGLEWLKQRNAAGPIPGSWVLPWQLYLGVSTGSLQASIAACGRYSDVEKLKARWSGLKGIGDIMKMRSWGWLRLAPIVAGGSLYTFEPLREILQKDLSDEDIERIRRYGNRFLCGYTDMQTLTYKVADDRNPNIRTWIEASCSVPGYHEGVFGRYFDGGVRNITPLADAIHAGATEIDVLLASPLKPTTKAVPKTVFGRVGRAIDGLTNEIMRDDLREVARRNLYPRPGDREIKIRVYMPSEPVNASWCLKPGDYARMFQIGYALAAHPLTVAQALGEEI